MSDDNDIIDVEVEEIEDSDNLPAVIESETHAPAPPIEATRSQTADGRDWTHGPKPERRCTAHSSRTGDPCKNAAIKGHNVCRYHGGSAKHVKEAARIRLEHAADLMAKQLLEIALAGDTDTVKLAAIRDALDRAGLKAPSEVILSQGEPKPYEVIFDRIGGTPPDESVSATSGYDQAGLGQGVADAETACAPTQPHPGDQTQPTDQAEPREYGDYMDSSGWSEGSEYSRDESPRQRRPRERDRERQPQPGGQHITGGDAIRVASAMKAIESPHKGYRRP
jgi:hypothetical protein